MSRCSSRRVSRPALVPWKFPHSSALPARTWSSSARCPTATSDGVRASRALRPGSARRSVRPGTRIRIPTPCAIRAADRSAKCAVARALDSLPLVRTRRRCHRSPERATATGSCLKSSRKLAAPRLPIAAAAADHERWPRRSPIRAGNTATPLALSLAF